jgi:protein TonB
MVKSVILLIIFSICGLCCFSQKKETDTMKVEIINALELWPSYKGGVKELSIFINENINYPKKAFKDSIEGIVYISMDVGTDGSTHNHIVIKGIREDLDNEAIRIAKLIKFEKPAIQNGKPAKVKYTLPVEFKLSDIKGITNCNKRSLKKSPTSGH